MTAQGHPCTPNLAGIRAVLGEGRAGSREELDMVGGLVGMPAGGGAEMTEAERGRGCFTWLARNGKEHVILNPSGYASGTLFLPVLRVRVTPLFSGLKEDASCCQVKSALLDPSFRLDSLLSPSLRAPARLGRS